MSIVGLTKGLINARQNLATLRSNYASITKGVTVYKIVFEYDKNGDLRARLLGTDAPVVAYGETNEEALGNLIINIAPKCLAEIFEFEDLS